MISEEDEDEKHTQLAKLFVKYKFPMSLWPTQTINLHAHVTNRSSFTEFPDIFVAFKHLLT